MTGIDDFVRMAHLFNHLRAPVFRVAIQALQLPLRSRGLDAGCGIGIQALMLAEAVGPEGHVDTHAPLSDDHYSALVALFQMRWPYAFFTYSMFHGRVAG